MKRLVLMAVVAVAVAVLAGEGFAQMRGPMYGRMAGGPNMMGPGGGAGAGDGGGCPMAGWGGTAAASPVTEERAKELAQTYADRYLQGFTVDRVLPFTGGRGTAYTVELKGPEGQVRTFHVNPWGNVMPFGGPHRGAAG